MVTLQCSWQAVVLKASILYGFPARWTGLLGLELAGDEVRMFAQPAIAPARPHGLSAAFSRSRRASGQTSSTGSEAAVQACRSILRWAAWPMIQAAASAYFASHVAGLQGQLLEVMIGADNVA